MLLNKLKKVSPRQNMIFDVKIRWSSFFCGVSSSTMRRYNYIEKVSKSENK